MNQLTKELQEILLPRAVLVAYTYESSPYGGRQKFHLELRPVDGSGKMGAAAPVSHEFMNTLVENCSVETDSIPHGLLPPTMLWCDTRRGHGKYVWYNPPGRRRMYFKESLHIEDGEFNLPGIIYVVEKDRLNVHAFKGERPEAGDRLYKAPYFNTNATSGGVCLGNASLQAPQNPTFNQWLEYWEKRFWMSEFSHLGAGGNPTRNNLVLVTEKARNAPFDESELKLSGKQLKDLLT